VGGCCVGDHRVEIGCTHPRVAQLVIAALAR